MARFLTDIVNTDVRQLAPRVKTPTLVIQRRGDAVVPFERGRQLAASIPGARFLPVDGRDHYPLPGEPAEAQILDAIRAFLGDVPPTRAQPRGAISPGGKPPERRLVTVLFTDIAGSTERAAALGDRRWLELKARHHALVRRELARFGGHEVDTAGDGFFATFETPARAVRCACAVRDAVRALGIEIRAGLHFGEVEVQDAGVSGIAVHTGARVMALAGPGEVLVSRAVKDLVAGAGIRFAERGTHRLKGVPGEWTVFAVEAADD